MSRFFNDDWFDMPARGLDGGSLPAVNVKEEEEQFVVELAAPGMKKEDFKVEVNHDVLTISSERKEEHTEGEEKGGYTRREFSYQSFQRSFTLPKTVDAEHISARYEDGVLHLHVPKREEAKVKPARTIEIG